LAPTAQKPQLYCLLALTEQKTSHASAIVAWRLIAAEMCLPLRCVATSEARRGYSLYGCVRYPATSNKHYYYKTQFYCRVPFEVSVTSQFLLRANAPQYGPHVRTLPAVCLWTCEGVFTLRTCTVLSSRALVYNPLPVFHILATSHTTVCLQVSLIYLLALWSSENLGLLYDNYPFISPSLGFTMFFM
jgi:hypothetical protein